MGGPFRNRDKTALRASMFMSCLAIESDVVCKKILK